MTPPTDDVYDPALHDLGEALDRAAGLTLIEAGASLLLGFCIGLVVSAVYLQ